MRILVLTDRFLPEIAAPSFRVADHARVWIEDGHEVTVVTCAPNFPHGKVFDGYRNRWRQEKWLDGIRVVRLWSYMAENRGNIKRTLDHLSFVASAVVNAHKLPKCDVVLATSPPLFTALGGQLLARRLRKPWVFEVRDLWPATIQAVGAARGRILTWLERLEKHLYRKADRIVPLTNAFRRDLVSRGVPDEKIHVVTNGVDLEQFDRLPVSGTARQRLGIPQDAWLVGYVGTTGVCQGLSNVIEAAALCRDMHEVRFLIMGEGAERAKLEQLARDKQLQNIHFANFVPHEQIADYYRALDVALIHLRPDPLFETVIPSKIFEFMAASVPLLMATAGESAGIVQQAGCGLTVAPGDPQKLAAAVRQLYRDRRSLEELGRRGRAAVERGYSRRALARSLLNVLERAVHDYHGGENSERHKGSQTQDRGHRRERLHWPATGSKTDQRAA